LILKEKSKIFLIKLIFTVTFNLYSLNILILTEQMRMRDFIYWTDKNAVKRNKHMSALKRYQSNKE